MCVGGGGCVGVWVCTVCLCVYDSTGLGSIKQEHLKLKGVILICTPGSIPQSNLYSKYLKSRVLASHRHVAKPEETFFFKLVSDFIPSIKIRLYLDTLNRPKTTDKNF
jgi:hypothetical protein